MGGGSPTEWVISENLFRRHLTASQKAVVAFGMLPLLEAEAKERQRQSAGRGKKGAKKLATSAKGKASEIAARITHSNSRYIEIVKAIHVEAPELVEEVRNGTLTVPDAAEIAKFPKVHRSDALILVKSGGPRRKVSRIVRQVELEARSESAKKMKVEPKEVHLRPMTTKWGSCSTAGRATFDLGLLAQPAEFRKEVIVHELLHLQSAESRQALQGVAEGVHGVGSPVTRIRLKTSASANQHRGR